MDDPNTPTTNKNMPFNELIHMTVDKAEHQRLLQVGHVKKKCGNFQQEK